MKKNKKNNYNMQDLASYMSKSINDLLLQELQIELKKSQNKPLSNKEIFFDKYCVKPSTIINTITKRVEK